MRAHVFQHVPFEGLGQIAPWLQRAGFQLSWTRFFDSWELPDPATVDFLIVLGGPMSVHDEARHLWLGAETNFIREFIATAKPMLGICLGAQLLAHALGARVYPARAKEIGWFPITGVPRAGPSSAFTFPAAVDVFQWHGETFDLPPRAIHLARSSVCEHQAFQLGSAIGLQFHLETTPESARALIENARHELVPAPFIQSATDLLAAPLEKYQDTHRLLDQLLAYLFPPIALRLS